MATLDTQYSTHFLRAKINLKKVLKDASQTVWFARLRVSLIPTVAAPQTRGEGVFEPRVCDARGLWMQLRVIGHSRTSLEISFSIYKTNICVKKTFSMC
jgi:hypothetical protein